MANLSIAAPKKPDSKSPLPKEGLPTAVDALEADKQEREIKGKALMDDFEKAKKALEEANKRVATARRALEIHRRGY